MKVIKFELHCENGRCVLKSNDIVMHISDEDDFNDYLYVEKWCKYLNHPLYYNDDILQYARLESWINGYSCAKKYTVSDHGTYVEIITDKYTFIFPTPFIV